MGQTMKSHIIGVLLVLISGSKAVEHVSQSCTANAKCDGFYEGFNCSCNSGYKGSPLGCVNINECEETPEVCTDIETCNDIIGRYNCTCGSIDIICHDKAACLNGTIPECICDQGYTGNGTVCFDIDECLLRTHNCSENALCTNTEGSYTCTCYHGYEGNGFVCSDIDECERDMHECVLPKTCNNTEGSYDCVCGLDEFCDENARCLEVENITSCFCDVGYQGSGVECADVNECDGKHGCHEHASCINTAGSFRCVCNEPYEGDGMKCSSGSANIFSTLVVVTSLLLSLAILEW